MGIALTFVWIVCFAWLSGEYRLVAAPALLVFVAGYMAGELVDSDNGKALGGGLMLLSWLWAPCAWLVLR